MDYKDNFVEFRDRLIKNFKELENRYDLFEVELDKDELWNLYLDSFPKGTNEVYREKREYDCSCCRHFVKTMGNAVFINDSYELVSIWDFDSESSVFQPVITTLSKYVKSYAVTNKFLSKEEVIGSKTTREVIDSKVIKSWEHFYIKLHEEMINRSNSSNEELKGDFKSQRDVFKRSLEELSQDSIETVLELISQNSLYRGKEWESVLAKFLNYKKDYLKIDNDLRDNFVWFNVKGAGATIAKIRNSSIGTLLIDITDGVDLDVAVRKFEAVVAPTNYKRPKPAYSKRMLEEAKKDLENMGYIDSLNRRFATLDDITVNNILFSNKFIAKRTQSLDVFEELEKSVAINPKKFSKVEEISIDDFINNVLPKSNSLEVLMENRHSNNLMSLIAPQNNSAKSMFKWNNSFSWAYKGNIADSSMKENVKNAGGKIDGVLRFSIQWNDEGFDNSDLDAHCVEPDGNHIFFADKRNHNTDGVLDVDIQRPVPSLEAVENITWPSINRMAKGKYLFYVNNYANRGNNKGFKAEIEFDGQIYSFDYNQNIRTGSNVKVAEVYFDETSFTIKELLPSTTSSREVWNLQTNQFVPVTSMMLSPNYWDEQDGIGNKHYLFMLSGCVNDERPNGFFNEQINNDLMKHKHVLEALGNKLSVVDADDQLSGLGFSSTKHTDLIVKVKGNTERILKIKI